MKRHKLSGCITAAVLSAALMLGTPVLPEVITGFTGLCIDAEAASSDITVDKDGVLTKYTGNGGKVKIPSKIDGVTVKKIGSRAFEWSSVTEVTIPDTVTEIGAEAFRVSRYLKKVTVPDSVTRICHDCFEGCTELRSVSLGKGLEIIETQAFRDCISLKTINIPAKVSSIGVFYTSLIGVMRREENLSSGMIALEEITVDKNNENFKSAGGVLFSKDGKKLIHIPLALNKTSYTVPGTVTEIGAEAYNNSSDAGDYTEKYTRTKIKKLTIPGTVKTIGKSAFRDSGIEKLTIKSGVKKIMDNAFSGCVNLKKAVLPNSVRELGESVFAGCEALESINVPKKLTKIPSGFASNTKIKSLTVPGGVTEIALYAFYGCKEFRQLILPDTIEKVDPIALSICPNLKIKYKGKTYTVEKFMKLPVCK